jgi:hypothetical protein
VDGVLTDGVLVGGVSGADGKIAGDGEQTDIILAPSKAALRAASTAFSAASPVVDTHLPPFRISRAIS